MADTPASTPIKPPAPTKASEAATYLLQRIPRVKVPESDHYGYGYYKGGKPVFFPMTLDRSVAMGTLEGIAQGRVGLGDKSSLTHLNNAFIRPLEEAIKEASLAAQPDVSTPPETGTHTDAPPSPDIVENCKLLNSMLNAVDWAASFGLFVDQTLQIRRGKLDGMGFTAVERLR